MPLVWLITAESSIKVAEVLGGKIYRFEFACKGSEGLLWMRRQRVKAEIMKEHFPLCSTEFTFESQRYILFYIKNRKIEVKLHYFVIDVKDS